MSNFLHFPPRGEILRKLRGDEPLDSWREAFYEVLAGRLGSQVMDSAAFAFVLAEIAYELKGAFEEDELNAMTDVVLALTGDRQLAITVLQTVEERLSYHHD